MILSLLTLLMMQHALRTGKDRICIQEEAENSLVQRPVSSDMPEAAIKTEQERQGREAWKEKIK